MSAAATKPSIFIASSAEGIDIAYAIQEHLEYVAEPTVWTQGVFKPSSFSLLDLVNAAPGFQFAVFVFSADDVVTIRNATTQSVRDNVVFEFGLFIGVLGLSRCFFILPRQADPLHLPTDLLGLEPLTYAPDRSDANLVAALGPAASRIRRAVRATSAALPAKSGSGATAGATLEEYVALWNGADIKAARADARVIPSSPYGYDDAELAAHKALRRLFVFLETVADDVLSGSIDEAGARSIFAGPVAALWPHMFVLLAPANHAEDWWRPLPRLAELHQRWRR